jgi:hypothetical protein
MKNSHKHKTELHYCPKLGEHHLCYYKPDWLNPIYKRFREVGAFILPLEVAPPAPHTLVHRSLKEATPRPLREDLEYMIGVAEESGLLAVVSTIDNRTTEHYRRQLFIASIPVEEAIERLNHRMYVTQQELRAA